MIQSVSREESVTEVDPGAESGRKRRDGSFLGEKVPGRRSSIGNERGWSPGSMRAAGEGDGRASCWQRGERGMRTERERASTTSSGVRPGPGRNGETLRGFERGQAAICSER